MGLERWLIVLPGSGPVRLAAWFLLALGGLSCSPDLHEVAGPQVPVPPVPNLTGRVLRAGVPLEDVKVRLVVTPTDSTMDETRTDGVGLYGFSRVGPGNWTVKASGREPGDFARVSWEFVVVTDTTLQAPDLDLSCGGLQIDQPADGDSVNVPSFFRPILFQWQRPGREGSRVQARVFDSTGSSVWYSDRMATSQVRWNGLANKGAGAGHQVPPGVYTWNLRVDWQGNPEYTTDSRTIVLLGPDG